MQEDKKGFFSNPFAKKPKSQDATTSFMAPQAGDPGYVAPPPLPKGAGIGEEEAPQVTAEVKTVAQKGAKLPVAKATSKRGLDLLKEDLLKNAPERAGVGRQDTGNLTMKPVAGEPGYKPESFQTVRVSELGISPFPDDKNAVGKVGGLDAVKKAAVEAKKGKSGKEIKKSLLAETPQKIVEEKVFDIPDYLKPIPEDTPRKGLTWKNYVGR